MVEGSDAGPRTRAEGGGMTSASARATGLQPTGYRAIVLLTGEHGVQTGHAHATRPATICSHIQVPGSHESQPGCRDRIKAQQPKAKSKSPSASSNHPSIRHMWARCCSAQLPTLLSPAMLACMHACMHACICLLLVLLHGVRRDEGGRTRPRAGLRLRKATPAPRAACRPLCKGPAAAAG